VNQVRVQFDLRDKIIRAQVENDQFKRIKGQIEKEELKELCIDNRIIKHENRLCIPQIGGLREEIMSKAYSTPYTAHPGSIKMYQDLRRNFWWNGMKRDIVEFVQKNQVCQQVKEKHMKPLGLLMSLPIPEWK